MADRTSNDMNSGEAYLCDLVRRLTPDSQRVATRVLEGLICLQSQDTGEPATDHWYSPQAAAPLLGYESDESVKRLIRRKRLPATKHNNGSIPRYKILGQDINDYLTKNRTCSASKGPEKVRLVPKR